MTPRIPPEQRRRQIIEAAFRLVVAEGIEGPSLRKVADESGMNIGSVRHYFDGHHELLAAAAEEAGDRMGRRLARHPVQRLQGLRGSAAIAAVQAMIEEVLPLDPQRRAEATVVLEFVMASRTRPVFRVMSERMGSDLSTMIRDALEAVGAPEPDLRAAQLAAVIGGLTVDALTPHGALSPERVRAVLGAQLRMILA